MRISHRELEKCRIDTPGWVRTQAVSTFRIGGYRYILGEAINRYHRTDSKQAAREYLAGRLARASRLTNRTRIAGTKVQLEDYFNWCDMTSVTVADSRVRLHMELSQELDMGGLISRVDLTQDGYRGIDFSPVDPSWKSELRWPLIQLSLSRYYGRPLTEFSVGHQDFATMELKIISFGKDEVADALSYARELAEHVASLVVGVQGVTP